jgi:hypothetical protein
MQAVLRALDLTVVPDAVIPAARDAVPAAPVFAEMPVAGPASAPAR